MFFTYFILFLFGISVGSFLNVLIDRLPKGQKVIWGRSKCDHCRKILRWFELIPVLSFILQNGKCRRCRKPLSLQYPLVELAAGIGYLYIFFQYTTSPILLIAQAILFSCLLVIFVADLKYTIIPDTMVLAGCIAAVMMIVGGDNNLVFTNRLSSAVGAAMVFLLIWHLTGGKGMGLGDVKLVLLLGIVLGFPMILVSLYMGFLTGAAAGVILILTGKKSVKSKIPFGPFLILGFWITQLWGNHIADYWMQYIR